MSGSHRGRTTATSPGMLVLRDSLGMGRCRKTRSRDPEKRALLLDLALKKIEKAERDNVTIIGARRRRVRVG
ncbi:MAG: hypothetical protein AB1806_05560 [Acidobacteriota bacterium]